MKVTKINEKVELKNNKNMHKPTDTEIQVHVDPVYGDAMQADTEAQKNADEVKAELDKKAKETVPAEPTKGKALKKNAYTEKIELDESLFEEYIKEEFYDYMEVKNFLKHTIEDLIDSDAGCSTLELNDRLGVCVGWEDGFDPDDDSVIHSASEPTYGLVAGLKVYTSDDMRTDYEWINYPYHADGSVEDTGFSIPPDYEKQLNNIAEYFGDNFDMMQYWDIDEDGLVIQSDDGEEDSGDEDDESFSKWYVASYYDTKRRGLEDDLETDDEDEARDFAWAKASRGGYVVVKNQETGAETIIDPDEVDDDVSEYLNDKFRETNESLSPKPNKKLTEAKRFKSMSLEDAKKFYSAIKDAKDLKPNDSFLRNILDDIWNHTKGLTQDYGDVSSDEKADESCNSNESKELTEKKGKVEGEDDNVYQLVYDALFLGNKNFRPHIADEAGEIYDWEQSLIMLPGYNDYDLGIALEKEEDGKYAKAVADKLGLKYEIKPTSSLSDGYKFIATVRIPDDIANKDATEYVTSIGLDMNTIRPKRTKKK